ncbi:outer membrane beta-barrel protein [Neolewinella antarctica]|uniref:Porin n=1 Tax=Neolewinella antarctica TaxID=442734 RepID=A0ABX0XGI8_9BACT|nr:outer membrane beta-barrel protein [Neolewinella antarctica]NJC27996.1 hypothetical protein [Neolewinella antarctica]
MHRFILVFLCLLSCQQFLFTQTDSDTTRHRVTLGGYVDACYASRSTDDAGALGSFLSAGPRDENFGLNVAQFSINYEGPRVRSEFTMHMGDIPESSWSPVYSQIQRANVGFRLAEKLWVDAGFFATHIGYESIFPRAKYVSSTAYLSWNEPFYQSGVRASYEANERWSFQLWLLNGYNSFVDNNDAKSLGLSSTYSPNDRTSITYNNLFGNEGLEGDGRPKQFRAVNNLYWTQAWTDRFRTVINFTTASQSNSELDDPGAAGLMVGAYLTADYAIGDRWNLTARLETYDDPDGIISGRVAATALAAPTGLRLSGLTTGVQYRPAPSAYVRAETRFARQHDSVALFQSDGERVDGRVELLLTCGVSFDWDHRW